jgi:hypothetical protein
VISLREVIVMPKYALVRDLDPGMTRAEIDGLALNALSAQQSYLFRGGDVPLSGDHGIRWIRSYWEQGGSWALCLYQAPSLAVLTHFQGVCETPFVDGYEVDELSDPAADGDGSTTGGHRLAVTFDLGTDGNPNEVPQAVTSRAEAGWVRTYWDPVGYRANALFRTEAADAALEELRDPEIQRIAKVIEIDPSEYQ